MTDAAHRQMFPLGDFRVHTVLDGTARRDDLHPRVAVNATREDVRALAEASGLPFPAYEQSFVPMVIETPGHLVVVDPGFGERSPGPAFGHFNARFHEAGFDVADVDLVLVTHAHPDHISNLTTRAGEPTFPNATIVFGRVEFDYWRKGEGLPEFRASTLARFREVCLPLAERARFVEAGEEVIEGISTLAAFGHSAGHLAFRVESRGESLMLFGDVAAHFAASFRHPEWHFEMDDDKASAVRTRCELLGRISDGGMMAAGFHMPFPAVGRVERDGDGFRWIPDRAGRGG